MNNMKNEIQASNEQPFNASIGGYKALGITGTQMALFSLMSKQVYLLSPSELKELNLKAVLGVRWCEENYTDFDERKEENFFNHRRLASDIISDCQACGPYSEAMERKIGVWKMDDGQLAINSDKLWRPDGTVLEHGLHEGRVYPATGSIGFELSTPAATHDEVNKVLGAFNSPQWTHPIGGEIILGFIGVGIVSVALKRRPHVLMTGPAACGKTTVLNYVRQLMGNLAYACTGPQTMAAFYQSLGGTSKVVINDEFEADPTRKSCKDTFDVARASYSLQEGDEGIVRGSVTGKSKSYRFYSPFIAAGISPGKMEPADLTRWVILESKGKPYGERLSDEECRDLGPKLAKLFINRWDVFCDSEDVVRQCILDKGGDGRMADTVGTLLASYWAFVSATPATTEDAEMLVGMLDIEERIALHEVSDEKQCFETLTSRVLPFKVLCGPALVTRQLSVGQAIGMVCKEPTEQPEVVTRLAQLGLRVALNQCKWVLYVVCSPSHVEARKLFASSKWSAGGWSTVLRRLPGGTESTQRIGSGFGASKVTVIHIPDHFLSADGVQDMRLAA